MGDRKVILLGLAPALKFSPESNSMSEFGGLWKQKITKHALKVSSLFNVKVGHYSVEEEDPSRQHLLIVSLGMTA